MRVAQVFLFLTALMSVVFGAIYLAAPYTMTDPMGFGQLAPSALTDVRATYGGLQLGMGLFLFWCLAPARLRTGLLFTLLSVGALAICRGIGLAIDGDVTSTLRGALIFEVCWTLITLFLFLRTPPSPTA
jgi:hypothetical protein